MGVVIVLRLAVLALLAHCASMQGARERCMINFLDGCKAHKTYMGIADDSAAAYDYMGVGQSEERCLARAKEYFEWCFNEVHQQVVSPRTPLVRHPGLCVRTEQMPVCDCMPLHRPVRPYSKNADHGYVRPDRCLERFPDRRGRRGGPGTLVCSRATPAPAPPPANPCLYPSQRFFSAAAE